MLRMGLDGGVNGVWVMDTSSHGKLANEDVGVYGGLEGWLWCLGEGR